MIFYSGTVTPKSLAWLDRNSQVELVWLNSDRSRLKLGYEETVKYFQYKLGDCHPTAKKAVKQELELAKNRMGKTLFEIIVEIIEEHRHVKLNLK